MGKSISILTLGLQCAVTFMVNFCLYMLLALLDSDFGIEGLFGLVFFQPIIASLAAGFTILICLVAGLPIRKNSKLNNWWSTNFYISIAGALCGLTFILLAFLPVFRETVTYSINEQATLKQIPNSHILIIGWFITAFSLLHLFPPPQLIKKFKSIFR